MWCIYALGGGWGHLTRAIALARAMAGQAALRILTNSPYVDFVRPRVPELDVRVVASVEETLHLLDDAETLIVDTFPRGLLGELAEWLPRKSARKVLVARDLNPEYVESFSLVPFVKQNFDLVLLPGEGEAFADLRQARWTGPWLVPSSAPRQSAQPAPNTAVICAAGNSEEQAWYGDVAARLCAEMPVQCVAATCPPGCPPALWQAHWPASELYASAAVVVGGGGYNTAYETQAAGVPLVARPWPRLYDRQELRSKRVGATLVTTPRQAVDAALRLRQCPGRRSSCTNGATQATTNGAAQAAALLSQATSTAQMPSKSTK